jgi:hypothetical protein
MIKTAEAIEAAAVDQIKAMFAILVGGPSDAASERQALDRFAHGAARVVRLAAAAKNAVEG